MSRRFIKGEAAERLHAYKYRGSDNSLTYKYFLSPLAEFAVNFVPTSVAPNLLTYFGHLFTLAVYFIPVWECGWGMECPLSQSSGLIATLCYFAWVQLDNMDGKQARRTSTSSALGLLFDHQVDSLVVTIASTYLGSVSLYGHSTQTICLWFIGSCAFFFATWEELCLGVMDFPVVNGACDGVLLLGFMSLLISCIGSDLFATYEFNGYSLRTCVFTFFIVGSAISGLFNFIRVVYQSKKRLRSVGWTASFFYYLITMYLIVVYSPSQVHISHTRELMLAFGFCFAYEMAMIQLAHVTDSDYTPIGTPSRLVIGGILLNMVLHLLGLSVVPEGQAVLGLALVGFSMYAYMAYYVVTEMAEELRIPIFTVARVKTK
mmetsp:Transcript_13351/g.25066  ORF Transcript_13351/g.25066 Transcript_13351/m.25066 type:complete len:375 (-) Transcript_13351:204-1328(-)|eukprot:CAMPEP_0204905380 /NCGR_PEP_ID=MMETSP1397-20131031/5386_1 /ASSEMBLY_ACC=CAM_ASM_000891 /TAXON_ID=49980 /ORGANISM="Climacostomum Climacostomum virens, Strain Stock W-24" /LENGTH=374 /DNA_ID=CAMNT_0052074253 /DNA_START=1409 /DNA_END=2533 /DNA_ORIENTATION=+